MELSETGTGPAAFAPPPARFETEIYAYLSAHLGEGSPAPSHPDTRPETEARSASVQQVSAHQILSELSLLEPGPNVMAQLAAIEVSALSGSDAITYLQVHERVASWWAARQVAALVRASGPERRVDKVILYDDVIGFDDKGSVTIVDAVREEVAAAMRWSPSTTQRRIDSARLLAGPMGETHRALVTGAITAGHAEAVVAAAQRFEGAWSHDAADRAQFASHCQALQSRVLPIAARSTIARTRQACARAIHAVDPAGASRRRHQALEQRDVYVIDEHDGISLLVARLATEHAHACLSVVNSLASVSQCDAAPVHSRVGVRRAEALASLILTAGDASASRPARRPAGAAGAAGAVDARPKGTAPIKAHVNLVIDLATLLGLRDGTAELLGAGPIPAEVVRGLLKDASLRRIITDPLTGHQLDYGRRVYAVPTRLRAFVAARDRTCRFPGCGQAASTCQVDHARPWADGGETQPENLGSLCTRHHQLKTHGGWSIEESDASGSCTWISPQGRRYSREAADLLEGGRLPPSTAPPLQTPGGQNERR